MPTLHLIALLAVVAVGSYLLGSINFAIIISRFYARDDVRRHGSGSAGMTNMLRTYGKLPAALTAAGDFLKTAVAIAISRLLSSRLGVEIPVDMGYLSGLFVMLGHLFPLYFGFKGGKGVVTTLGVIFCVNPIVFAIIAVIFIPLVFITRIVSLGSVLGAIAYPIITWIVLSVRGEEPLYDTLLASLFGIIVLVMHRDNIKRLLTGTENRFGGKK